MILALAVHAGGLIALIGIVQVFRALGAGRVSSRPGGVVMSLAGVFLILLALAVPAGEAVAGGAILLDRYVPRYQFAERHVIRVEAPPATVWRAIRSVTAGEVRLFRELVWLRRFGRPGPESILTAPEHMPLLDVATRTTFQLLAEVRDQEMVIGTLVIAPRSAGLPETPAAFAELAAPGFAKAAMNFRIESDAAGRGGSIVSTETRVFATDRATLRRFTSYWRLILPGSAIIRRNWLSAIRTRAES